MYRLVCTYTWKFHIIKVRGDALAAWLVEARGLVDMNDFSEKPFDLAERRESLRGLLEGLREAAAADGEPWDWTVCWRTKNDPKI